MPVLCTTWYNGTLSNFPPPVVYWRCVLRPQSHWCKRDDICQDWKSHFLHGQGMCRCSLEWPWWLGWGWSWGTMLCPSQNDLQVRMVWGSTEWGSLVGVVIIPSKLHQNLCTPEQIIYARQVTRGQYGSGEICEHKQTVPYRAILDHLMEVVWHGSIIKDKEYGIQMTDIAGSDAPFWAPLGKARL